MAQTVPEELLAEISAALERAPNINLHQWPLKVWTAEGQVVLGGTVESIAAKRAAVNTVRQLTEGKWTLMDLLRVARPGACPDLELGDEVGRNLSREPVFARYDLETAVGGEVKSLQDVDAEDGAIRADIHDGVVTLTGHVGSLSHRRLAEVLTWWAAGCQSVDNRLEVIPPEEDNDDELTDAVRMVLEKDPLVHASQLRIGTAGGVVTLNGLVGSEEEKRWAVRDTWYVPGVWAVDDRIEVESGATPPV